MPTPPPLDELRALINAEDWTSPDFTRAKAYVCATFAELAYWYIPAFELRSKDRVKVVPSEAYQVLVDRLLGDHTLTALLSAADFAPIVITRRHAVVLVVPTHRVIFVAIRGTVDAYDWLRNIDVRWLAAGQEGEGLYHRGFFHAIEDCFDPIQDVLKQYHADVPVYACGHSLGGAMAALLHATWVSGWTRDDGSHGRPTHSAYSVAMPRYGDELAVTRHRSPHHVWRDEDIVPKEPPTWFGFANSPMEYQLDGTKLERGSDRSVMPFIEMTWKLANKQAILDHEVEKYRRSLKP